MSGVWTNVMVLDLVVPSTGELVPGSGTIYIGGPRLPVGLQPSDGYRAAIVWYSDAIGLAAGIDYWFLAHFSGNMMAGLADGVRFGYYPTGGPTTVPMVTPLTLGGTKQTIVEAPDYAIVQSATGAVILQTNTGSAQQMTMRTEGTGNLDIRAKGGGLMQIYNEGANDINIKTSGGGGNMFLTAETSAGGQMTLKSGGNMFLSPGVADVIQIMENNGGTSVLTDVIQILGMGSLAKPRIKAAGSTNTDIWQNASRTVTLAGVANTVIKEDWRVTVDGVVELRIDIAFPVAPASLAFNFFLNAGVPAPDNGGNNLNVRGLSVTSPSGTVISSAMTTGKQMFLFGPAGAGQTGVSYQYVYTTDK